MEIMKLSKTVMIDGKEVTEIPYDLDSLTAEDVDNVSMELKKQKYGVTVPELDPKYTAGLFACSAGLAISDLKTLSAKDYFKVSNVVRDFLLKDSEESLEKII